MKYLNGKEYVEVKDKEYIIHPTDNIILKNEKKPKRLRTHYQVINNTQIRKNQKVIKKENNELEVKPDPKRKRKKHKVMLNVQAVDNAIGLNLTKVTVIKILKLL